MRTLLALSLLVLGACGGSDASIGSGSSGSGGSGAVHESPAPQCHDVPPSTRAVTVEVGQAGTASGGSFPKDGRYELARAVGPSNMDGLDTPEAFVVSGGNRVYRVFGDTTRRTCSARFTPASSGSPAPPRVELTTTCGDGSAPPAVTEQYDYSETPTGFKLHLGSGAFEYVRAN